MFAYKFRYNTNLEYEFNDTFFSSELSLGGELNFNLQRPFGLTDIYQPNDLRIQAQQFTLTGKLISVVSGLLVDQQIVDLNTALETCDRLLSTDRDGNNEAYVDCQGASQVEQVALTPDTHRVTINFWVSEDMWRLSSDDSKTVI